MQPPPLPAKSKRSNRHTVLIILAIIGGAIIAVALLATAIFMLVSGLLRGSDPYQHALQLATSDPRVIERLGEPVEPGWMPSGNIQLRNSRGNANLHITLHGPQGEGSVDVVATKGNGVWTYYQLEFNDPKRGDSFSLEK